MEKAWYQDSTKPEPNPKLEKKNNATLHRCNLHSDIEC